MSDTAFSADVTALGDKIATLTLVQAVELKEYLKEKYKIEPAAGGGMMMAGPAAPVAAVEKAPEPTEFQVILEGLADPTKSIQVIKVVREITGNALGLKEAKELVTSAPKTIPGKEAVDKPTAEKLKKQIEDAGGKASIKPAA